MDKQHPLAACSFCGKKIIVQNMWRHIAKCDLNPKNIERKLKTIFCCKKCGKKYSLLESNSVEFCSRTCANSRNIKDEANSTKVAICTVCDKTILINKRRSDKKIICPSCKEKLKLKKRKPKTRDCQFCGRDISVQSIKRHEKACKQNPCCLKTRCGFRRKDVRQGYIYKITNQINSKIYIGKKAGLPENSKRYFGSGLLIKKAILKYGRAYFSKEIIEIISDGDLNERERFWIKEFNSNNLDIGYNLTEGGDGGHIIKSDSELEA